MRLASGHKGFVLEPKTFDRVGEKLGRIERGPIALSGEVLSDRLIIKPLVMHLQNVLL